MWANTNAIYPDALAITIRIKRPLPLMAVGLGILQPTLIKGSSDPRLKHTSLRPEK